MWRAQRIKNKVEVYNMSLQVVDTYMAYAYAVEVSKQKKRNRRTSRPSTTQ